MKNLFFIRVLLSFFYMIATQSYASDFKNNGPKIIEMQVKGWENALKFSDSDTVHFVDMDDTLLFRGGQVPSLDFDAFKALGKVIGVTTRQGDDWIQTTQKQLNEFELKLFDVPGYAHPNYVKGCFYTSTKGLVISDLLNFLLQAHKAPKRITFSDDLIDHINDVRQHLTNLNWNGEAYLFHFQYGGLRTRHENGLAQKYRLMFGPMGLGHEDLKALHNGGIFAEMQEKEAVLPSPAYPTGYAFDSEEQPDYQIVRAYSQLSEDPHLNLVHMVSVDSIRHVLNGHLSALRYFNEIEGKWRHFAKEGESTLQGLTNQDLIYLSLFATLSLRNNLSTSLFDFRVNSTYKSSRNPYQNRSVGFLIKAPGHNILKTSSADANTKDTEDSQKKMYEQYLTKLKNPYLSMEPEEYLTPQQYKEYEAYFDDCIKKGAKYPPGALFPKLRNGKPVQYPFEYFNLPPIKNQKDKILTNQHVKMGPDEVLEKTLCFNEISIVPRTLDPKGEMQIVGFVIDSQDTDLLSKKLFPGALAYVLEMADLLSLPVLDLSHYNTVQTIYKYQVAVRAKQIIEDFLTPECVMSKIVFDYLRPNMTPLNLREYAEKRAYCLWKKSNYLMGLFSFGQF